MKAPDGDDWAGMLACMNTSASDGQDDMSKQGGSPNCEYRRAIARVRSTEQSAGFRVLRHLCNHLPGHLTGKMV